MGLGLAAVEAEIDTCSGHKVDYSLTGSTVVTEDNLSALSTFQQHISPSFTMAVIKPLTAAAVDFSTTTPRQRDAAAD